MQQTKSINLQQMITFINGDEDSRSTQAELSEISLFEATLFHTDRLADMGQRGTITMSFEFAGQNNVIVLEGVISSANFDDDSASQTLTLCFEELDYSDTVLLHAYIYERMLVSNNIIADPAIES